MIERQASREEFLRQRFIHIHGSWTYEWDAILRLDREFFEAYLALSSVPHEKSHLGAEVREFIHIAVSATTTHLFVPGIRHHVRRALDLGASVAEIMEVLELSSAIGIHAAQVGVPLLLEALAEEGKRQDFPPLTDLQSDLKSKFVAARGYWHSFWDDFLAVDPEMFEAYTEFSAVPWRSGTLNPKVKEFVYCALNASTTHLYAPGLKMHMTNAIRLGATRDELMEVLEIVSLVGIDTVTVAAPILLQESERPDLRRVD